MQQADRALDALNRTSRPITVLAESTDLQERFVCRNAFVGYKPTDDCQCSLDISSGTGAAVFLCLMSIVPTFLASFYFRQRRTPMAVKGT